MKFQTVFSTALLLAALWPGTVAFSQTPPPSTAESQTEAAPEVSAPYPNANSGKVSDAERARIWNSPRMLRARAWVQEYCERSARISPEEASQYLAELERMTPIQMKLWLLKFDEEQEQIDQQKEAFKQTRQASVGRAREMNEATEEAYNRVSQGVNREAEIAQRSLVAQEQAAQQMYAQRADNSAAAATTLLQPNYRALYSPLYGRYPGVGFPGAVHFHTHTR